jgi:hypothetical protein
MQTTELTVKLLLLSAALSWIGIVWVSRKRFARRFQTALDAYADLEITRTINKT